MSRTSVIVIGAGPAGLAVGHLLTRCAVGHVVLERGRVADSWRNRRWDSLRLLTPNWMTRLPGWQYRGDDPDGFMSAAELVRHLDDYARVIDVPVQEENAVVSVRRCGDHFRVVSTGGVWTSDAVVVATGNSAVPFVPRISADLDTSIHQVTPDGYKNPSELPDGGVLVVGSAATGVQLADELARAGRDVTLAVGRHDWLPRTYRGIEIMWWLEQIGVLDRRREDLDRPTALTEPSLQLIGRSDGYDVGLAALQDRGVRLTGRLVAGSGQLVGFADDLATHVQRAQDTTTRVLARIDTYAARNGLDREIAPARTYRRVKAALSPAIQDLRVAGIRTVIWATGYRRDYPWMHVPVLGANADIRHRNGVTTHPGLYVVGMAWQSRRKSSFIDGIRYDAATVVDHLLVHGLRAESLARRAS